MTMTNNSALLSTEGILILCAYILTLIGIGWLGKKAQKEQSLDVLYNDCGIGIEDRGKVGGGTFNWTEWAKERNCLLNDDD